MKQILVLLFAMTIMFVSCGGEASSNGKKSKKKEYFEKLKTYDMNTEEGMSKRLLDYYKLTIPSQLTFVEINHKDGRKMILKAENITEEELAELNNWYKKECQRLVDDGYKKTVTQDNTKMMGMIFNDSFYQKKTDYSTSTEWRVNSIGFYSVYKIDKKVYELRISLNE